MEKNAYYQSIKPHNCLAYYLPKKKQARAERQEIFDEMAASFKTGEREP